MQASNEITHVDEEGVFFLRTALLICKAHVNAESVTYHLRERKNIGRLAFCIYLSPSSSSSL